MKLLEIQIALFVGEQIERPDLVYDAINEKTGKIFDDMPTIISIPSNLPGNFPVVQAKSTDGQYRLTIAQARSDLFINADYDSECTPLEIYKQYQAVIGKYCKTFFEAVKSISRVGVIFNLFEPREDNRQAIFSKYLKEKFSINYSEVSIRLNKQNTLKGITYNNITDIEAVEVRQVNKPAYQGVRIQLDTNNVPQAGVHFTTEMISGVLRQASSRIKDSAIKEMI